MSSVLYCGGYQVLRGFLSPEVRCLVWKESPWPVRDCGQGGRMGGWEYGLVKEVCLLEEEVCLWGMHSTVSIHIHGRKIYQQQQQQQ